MSKSISLRNILKDKKYINIGNEAGSKKELMKKVDTLVIDKTGTLTVGKPQWIKLYNTSTR